jgi:hypothetical protein
MAKNGKEYFTVKENTYFKDKELTDNAPKEVPASYKPYGGTFKKSSIDDDSDVPFN